LLALLRRDAPGKTRISFEIDPDLFMHEWDRVLPIVASLEELCLAYSLLFFTIRFAASLATGDSGGQFNG
jgi:hypothetical protein